MRRSRRGMTLVEVMVVAAILFTLMAVLSIGVSGTLTNSQVDTERLRQARQAEADEIASLRRREAAPEVAQDRGPTAPSFEAVDLDLTLGATPVAEWPWVHTLLEVTFYGQFVATNPDPSRSSVRLRFPLHPGAQGVRFEVALPNQEALVPVDAVYTADAVEWEAPLAAGETLTVELSYRAAGVDAFSWQLADAQKRPIDVHAVMTLPAGFDAEVPSTALQPTGAEGRTLRWQLDDLVAPAPIRVELPAGTTPLGRIATVCWLAVLGLIGFCGGLWYLAEGERPGHLDDFRLGGLLLLGLNYASFYAIFAVTGVQLGPVAALVALCVSLPLLTLHVARLTTPRFAITRVTPLAALTIGAVLGFAYLAAWRPLVSLGVAVGAVAWVTVTWRAWSSGRRAWATVRLGQQVRDDRVCGLERKMGEVRHAIDLRAGQANAARRTLAELPSSWAERADTARVVDRLEHALARARSLLQVPDAGELLSDTAHREHCAVRLDELARAQTMLHRLGEALGKALEALEQSAVRAVDELSVALGEMERALDDLQLVEAEARTVSAQAPSPLGREVASHLEQLVPLREEAAALSVRVTQPEGEALRALAVSARQLAHGACGLATRLRSALRRSTEAMRWQEPDEGASEAVKVHCQVCGGPHAQGSRFCSACGSTRPIELACGGCGRVSRLPRHLLREDWHRERLYCGLCGIELQAGAVQGELCRVAG